MNVSLFYLFPYPTSAGKVRFESSTALGLYRRNMDQWTSAEDHGFYGVYFSEHHFDAISMSPSPNLLVSAMSQRTSRIMLGVLVAPTPLYPAWRLAEEVAMLDYLTGMRLEVGFGAGLASAGLERAGIRSTDTVQSFRKKVDLITDYWSSSEVGTDSPSANLNVIPKPLRDPYPEVWIPTATGDGARWAARRGFNLLCGRTEVPQIVELVAEYRAEVERVLVPGRVAIRRRVLITTDTTGFLTSSDEFVVGTAAEVVEELRHQVAVTGCSDLLLWLDFPGVSADMAAASFEVVAEEVLPRLAEL